MMQETKDKLKIETNDDCVMHQSPPLEENSPTSFVAAKKTNLGESVQRYKQRWKYWKFTH